MAVIAFITIFLCPTAVSLKPSSEYGYNECELIAKDYQEIYGGDLIFIQPLAENGAYDFGAYNGHWINKVWNKNQGTYYFDYQNQIYFQSIDGIRAWYKWQTGRNAEIFNINQGGRSFAIIWHY